MTLNPFFEDGICGYQCNFAQLFEHKLLCFINSLCYDVLYIIDPASAIPCRLLTYHIVFIMMMSIINSGVVVNTCKEFDTLPLSKGNPSVRATLPLR